MDASSSSHPISSRVALIVGGVLAAAAAAVLLKGRSKAAPSEKGPSPPRASTSACKDGTTPVSDAVSPRSPGVLAARTRQRRVSGTADPWKVSEGDRKYELGKTSELDMAIEEFLLLDVPSLATIFPDRNARLANVRRNATLGGDSAPYLNVVSESDVIIADIVRQLDQRAVTRAFLRAGPRATTFFDPTAVRAAIVTCGGLCPGLNNVIRELVCTLWHAYGVRTIYGIQGGYWGFHTTDAVGPDTKPSPNRPLHDPPLLTPEVVADIHHFGGTFLGSDRGGHDVDVILRFLERRGVNQLYVIGGDGTHRGADAIYRASAERGAAVAVAAIPKTIDNDIDLIDRSFGFDTSFAEAQLAIKTAKVEASGSPRGIGIVKLMGRYAGFIAAHATLASGDVDLCLIPEVPVALEGPASVLTHVERVVAARGHAVIVVAEGAGEEEMCAELRASGAPVETDAGGNRKLPPVGEWLQGKVAAHFAAAGTPVTIRYVDPSYMIRSVAAHPADAIYCTLLAQSSVHGAMAGLTGFSTGLVNSRLVYVPITAITANSPRRMNPRGRTYERLLATTCQPDPLSDPAVRARWKGPGDAPKGAM